MTGETCPRIVVLSNGTESHCLVLLMVSDLDTWRTAKPYVVQYGDEAATRAAMRADELMEAGDMEGRAVWLRVLAAVKNLMTMEPKAPVH